MHETQINCQIDFSLTGDGGDIFEQVIKRECHFRQLIWTKLPLYIPLSTSCIQHYNKITSIVAGYLRSRQACVFVIPPSSFWFEYLEHYNKIPPSLQVTYVVDRLIFLWFPRQVSDLSTLNTITNCLNLCRVAGYLSCTGLYFCDLQAYIFMILIQWCSHWGGKGGRVPPLTAKKNAKNWGKIRQNREEKAKFGKFLSLCPSWQIGLATLLFSFKFSI